jgi:hypothetical protein
MRHHAITVDENTLRPWNEPADGTSTYFPSNIKAASGIFSKQQVAYFQRNNYHHLST